MGKFQNNAITDVGRILLGQVQMGEVFTPTKIVIGSGRLPSGTTTRTIKAVVSPVITLQINKKQMANDGTIVIGGVYSNESITSDFYFRELALYAKAGEDGQEVLYSYGNAGETADYMPAYTSGTPVQRQIDLAVYIGNDTQVDLTIADGVYVTADQLEAYVPKTEKGVANGVAELDGSGKVPSDQLPDMDYIPTSEKGVANGVAELDGSGKVPSDQLPDMDYIPTSEKGVANGVATLGENGKVPKTQIPTENSLIVTLVSTDWTGETAPYTQTVSCSGVTSNNDVLIAPKIDDAADMEMVSDARIMATAQATGTITFSAFGDKPTGNIEFNVKVLI